jgi:hypothetical protein
MAGPEGEGRIIQGAKVKSESCEKDDAGDQGEVNFFRHILYTTNMLKKVQLHGAYINYDDGEPYISKGLSHLQYHLTGEQAKPLYQQAKAGGEVQFVGIDNHKFALIFQKHNFDMDMDNFLLSSIKSN